MRIPVVNDKNTNGSRLPGLCLLGLIGLALTAMRLGAAEIAVHSAAIDQGTVAIDWWVRGADAQRAQKSELLIDGAPIETPPPVLAPEASLSACYLFMVDTSLSMKRPFETAVIPLLTDLMRRKPPQQDYAIARFAAEFERLGPFAKDAAVLRRAVASLALRGQRTELFSAVLSGLKELSRCSGYRRVMVLLSDGDAEDDPIAYTLKDAVQAARQQKVAIYTLGFNDSIKLQILRRLSEDTHAWHWRYQAGEAAALPRRLAESTDTGGRLRVPLAQLPAGARQPVLRVTLADHRQLQAPLGIELPQRLPAWRARLRQVFPAIPLWAWGLGLCAAVGGIVLLGIGRWRRRKKASQEREHANPAAFRKPLATLRAGDTEFVMDKRSISIGALPENDLVIDDPTVSRHQAIIDYQDEQFYLTDRGATNPCLVNGTPVRHCALAHNDVLQFGDWRGVFAVHESLLRSKNPPLAE